MKEPPSPSKWMKRIKQALFDNSDTDVKDHVGDVVQKKNLSGNIEANVKTLRHIFNESDDLVVRRIKHQGRLEACVVYLHGAASSNELADQVIRPIIHSFAQSGAEPTEAIAAAKTTDARTFYNVVEAIVNGRAVVFFAGSTRATVVWIDGWKSRSISPPMSELTQGGPADGFSEDLSAKVSLIRRRLRTNQLMLEEFNLGQESNTPVAIMYLANIIRPEIVEEMRQRLKNIELDGILDINYIKEMILENPWSPWPNFLTTERPDRVAAGLLEGQLVVMIEGSPWTLLAPSTIDSYMQSPDDYYTHFYMASFLHSLRWVAATIALLFPSLYVSVLSFHHELIPTHLLYTILSSREFIPLAPFLEALIMELAFEVLREAGLRMPQQVGPALSIVGVLVIGDAAVTAGIVSPLMIMIVGLTAISTFAIPSKDFNNAIRLLRFPALVVAGLFGLFGVLVYTMVVIGLLVRMRTLGTPMMSPLLPFWPKGFVDSPIRGPWWSQHYRPWRAAQPGSSQSQPKGQLPKYDGNQDDIDDPAK